MLYAFLIVLIVVIFHNWFTFFPISSGDLSFFFKEQIVAYFNPPFLWETFRNVGFGGNSFLYQGVYYYNLPMGILGQYLSYGVIERIIWFFPILIIGFLSPMILSTILKLFPSRFYPIVALLYFLNTYFFMIMGGGQFTVVFGYIAIPLIFAVFLITINNIKFYKLVLFSLLLSFLVAFDFRYIYIFLVIVFLYALYSCIFLTTVSEFKDLIKRYLVIFLFSFPIVLAIHAYWFLPYVVYYHSPTISVGRAYTSTDAVTYFSFAQFEHAISLLHPFWPENIFGKVGFMKGEFLLLPFFAFISLLFINSKRCVQNANLQRNTQQVNNNGTIEQYSNKIIPFFVLLGLIGAFLGKGANPPFGEWYVWLFTHIPGFIMFRDPTKWYTLVALSYSILIPFSVWRIYEWFSLKKKFSIFSIRQAQDKNFQFSIKSQVFNFQNIFIIFFISFFLFLIHPAILGQIGGTLKPITVPQEYIDYKNFLLKKDNFFRVLWFPTMQRFTFYSNTHPAIPGRDFFQKYENLDIVEALQKDSTKTLLQESAVQYVVVPDDTEREIFIKDRKYNEEQYQKTLHLVEKIPWLKKVTSFGRIHVFELDNPKGHFWSPSKNIQIQTSFINPTEYHLTIKNAQKGDSIIFTEQYDKNWYIKDQHNIIIFSTPYNSRFNSFVMEEVGDYSLTAAYKPQELVPLALAITTLSLGGALFAFIGLWRKKW